MADLTTLNFPPFVSHVLNVIKVEGGKLWQVDLTTLNIPSICVT